MIYQTELEAVYDFLQEATGTLENIEKSFAKKFSSEFFPSYILYHCLCDNVAILLYASSLRGDSATWPSTSSTAPI